MRARHDLSTSLREVSSAPTDSFVELVRRSGLNPATDFRNANLAGTDLRREDLTGFDFRRANFAGAKVYGTRFNESVKPHQLRSANHRTRAVVLPLGQELEQFGDKLAPSLDTDFDVPPEATAAIQRAGALRERIHDGGAYLSDNSPLLRRHLTRDLKKTALQARAANLAIFLAQPQGDFDFDMIGVAQRAFRSSGTPVFTILFSASLAATTNVQRLIERRIQESGIREADTLLIDDGGTITRRSLSSEWKDGQTFRRVLEFLNISATATRVSPANVKPNRRAGTDVKPALLSGRRAHHETLAATISRLLGDAHIPFDWDPPRFHLLVAQDSFRLSEAQEAYEMLGRRNLCDVSIYPSTRQVADFHLAVAPPDSTLWGLFSSVTAPSPFS